MDSDNKDELTDSEYLTRFQYSFLEELLTTPAAFSCFILLLMFSALIRLYSATNQNNTGGLLYLSSIKNI